MVPAERLLRDALCEGGWQGALNALTLGADPNAHRLGPPPLCLAVESARIDLVELLIDFGANPSVADELGYTPLHCTADYSLPDIVNLLLLKGSCHRSKSLGGQTPLHRASQGGSEVDCIRLLIQAGALVNAKCSLCETPLHCAARVAWPFGIQSLLELGARPDARSLFAPHAARLMLGFEASIRS